jgi:hypothetical protein
VQPLLQLFLDYRPEVRFWIIETTPVFKAIKETYYFIAVTDQ